MNTTKQIPSESFYLAVGNLAHQSGYFMSKHEALQRCQRGVIEMGLNWQDIVSPVRRRELVDVRKMVSYFLRDQGWTYKSIGEVMNRDHATAVHHVRTFRWLMETYSQTRGAYTQFCGA